jgi:glycosyltransferase involved in cell wall biosynthesis
VKVLVVSHAYAAPINREKLRALARRPGLEVSLLLPEIWREGEREYRTEAGEEDGYRIFTGSVLFSGRVTGHAYRDGLFRALREVRPDLIHLEEEPWSAAAVQVMAASSFLRPRPGRVLFSFENLDLNLAWYYRAAERFTMKRADILIAAGISSRDRLLRRGADPARLAVLPQFGLDPGRFSLPGAGERGEVFTVGFMGRHVHQKGVDLLIRALAELGGEWRAFIVGDGPKRGEWESLAESLGIGERVEFPGWLDHFEMPEWLRRMHVLVLPARTTPTSTEQFGHVLIEAMSSGVVPVGSDSGEIPNVIGEEGLVFPEEDHKKLGEAIRRLRSEDGFLERLARLGRERVLRDFSWEVLAEKTHAIYERALASGNGKSGGEIQ